MHKRCCAGAATGDNDTEDGGCGDGTNDTEMEEQRAVVPAQAASARAASSRAALPVGSVSKSESTAPRRATQAARAAKAERARQVLEVIRGGGFVDCEHCGEPAYAGQFCGQRGRVCANP